MNVNYGVSLAGGSISIQPSPISRTGDGVAVHEVVLPAGKAGTLSTRTDNDTGIVTAAGHALAQNDKVDVYWDGGVRYGMTVGIVAGDDVPIDLGAGDNLPAEDEDVVIVKQVSIVTTIDGDNLQIIGIMAKATNPASTAKAHVDLQDAGAATIAEIDLAANQPHITDVAGGAANPFTGNPITSVKASNGSSSEEITLQILALADSTP